MIILFEGRDASGKGGAIRTLSRYMNSKKYRIVALGKPTEEEKQQWYFQKYIKHFPTSGEIVLFDRSWYNRAMVEPVFDFCTHKEYKNFFLDIKDFEKSIVRNNIVLVKIYYSVSKKMQAIRFERRSKDPLRQWKLSEVDLQAQSLWDEFTNKKYKMINNSEISEAPWQIIRSDNKYITRLETMKTILRCVDYANKNFSLNYKADERYVYDAKQELNFMNKHNE
jgi:polyphosphate kinase 2